MIYQSTILKSASISGRGLHSGKEVTLTFKPAPENHGIAFQRIDLPAKPIVKALVTNVYDTSRGTSIKEGEAEMKTVEHVMAALAGLAIDNILIEVDGEEAPIMDGSAKPYIQLLSEVGIKKQNAFREYITVNKEIIYEIKEKGILLKITPADDFRMTVNVDYETDVLGKQIAEVKEMDDFLTGIFDARTFVFLHELQFLIAHNLVKGGDVDNAVVFVDKKPSREVLDQLALFFNKEEMDITENGTLNHNPLRYPNEPARHKLLDLIGDLYLLGKPLKGHVIAYKPGHFANTEFGKLILSTLMMQI